MSSPTPANEWVCDTMALVLRLEGRVLGAAAERAFEDAEQGKATILVPGMVLVEILYLSEKKRISTTLADVANYLVRHPGIREYPMSLDVVQATAQVNDIRDLHDRLIAGTAKFLQRPLITNDPVIRASAWVSTSW